MSDSAPVYSCVVCNTTPQNEDGSCVKCHQAAVVAMLRAEIQGLQDSLQAAVSDQPSPPVPFVDRQSPRIDHAPVSTTNGDSENDVTSILTSSLHFTPSPVPVVRSPSLPFPQNCITSLPSKNPTYFPPPHCANSTAFVDGVIKGVRPIIGAGSQARNHGIQLVLVWGLAAVDTPLPLSSLSSLQLHSIPALVSKHFFDADKRVILEEQSLLRDTFNSVTMPLQLPLFLVSVKQVKTFFRSLIRQNMRHAMLETARQCLVSTGYIPYTHLRCMSDFVLEMSRDLSGAALSSQWLAWWAQIKSTHICDWAPVSRKNNLDILSALSMDAMGIAYRQFDGLRKGCFRRVATRVFHDQVTWLKYFRTAMVVSMISS